MAQSWPSKDPDETLDYSWSVPLDADDAITSAALTVVSGTVTIASQDATATGLTAFLSGGADGETAIFSGTATTEGGRTFEETFYLVVRTAVDAEVAALRARYPAFASVPSATIRYWLDDAARFVDSSWTDADRPIGLLACAAHHMAMNGLGSEAATPQGVTSFKSGTFSATVDAHQAGRTGMSATRCSSSSPAASRAARIWARLVALASAFSGPSSDSLLPSSSSSWVRSWAGRSPSRLCSASRSEATS